MAQRTLVLVRHGQTSSNRLGLIQGRKDVDLCEEGIREAEELRVTIGDEPFDAAYASELVRARHTAGIILRGRDLKLTIDPRLNEIDQGDWTDKSARDLFKTDERYREWVSHPIDTGTPNGEMFMDVVRRAESFLKDAQGSHPLVVAHGGVIAIMRAVAGEAPLEKAWTLLPKNAQVVRIILP